MRRAAEAVLLVVACAALYLVGAADIPFYTRGEPREGLVVREMLRTGEWLVPARPDGEPARKPPLYYWTAAAAMRALPSRPPELALRLPSAALATAAVLGTWATARAAWGPAAALPAGLVLATGFEWTRAATSARVDMALAAMLAGVLCAWTLVVAGKGTAWRALAVAGMALGTLAKGPVALALPTLAAGVMRVFRRDARSLRAVTAIAAAGTVAAVWYVAAYRREGGAFLDVVARENWLRFVDTEAAGTGHRHGPAYLVPLGLVGLLPWTPLLPLVAGAWRPRPRLAATTLALAWVGAGLAFFSISAAKRSAYLLPLHPAIALLLGAGIAAAAPDGRPERAARLGAWLWVAGGLVAAVVAAAVAAGLDPGALVRPWLAPRDAEAATTVVRAAREASAALVALAAGTLVAVALVARDAARGRWRRLVVVVALAFVAWTAWFDHAVHPAIARERSLKTFLATDVADGGPLYALFPADPGLRFYAPATLRAWPAGGTDGGGRLLVWEDDWQRLRDRDGRPLRVIAISDARQPGRGRLALVEAPAGPLVPATDVVGPPSPLRTDSRRR